MRLYVVRHGKAEVGSDDHARRLTKGGREKVRAVADVLAASDIRPDLLEHSGLVRAEETAEILREALGVTAVRGEGLEPEGSVEVLARRLSAGRHEDVMVVGHMPSLGRLVAYLVTENPDADLVHLRTGTVVCLSNEDGPWVIEWMLPPMLAARR